MTITTDTTTLPPLTEAMAEHPTAYERGIEDFPTYAEAEASLLARGFLKTGPGHFRHPTATIAHEGKPYAAYADAFTPWNAKGDARQAIGRVYFWPGVA